MNDEHQLVGSVEPVLPRMRQIEGREWWLWGFAVSVTLVLTFGILSLTNDYIAVDVSRP
jgi:hypothetical protein